MNRSVCFGAPIAAVALALAALLALVTVTAGCRTGSEDSRTEPESTMAKPDIEETLAKHTDRLMAIEGVVGTAIGECDGRPCIKIYVVRKTDRLLEELPTELDGFTVSVEETGEFQALDST